MIQVRCVDTNSREDVNRFVNFPFDLYRDNKQWVPPLIGGARAMLDRDKHAIYHYADVDYLLAERNGEVVGRLAVLEHHRFNKYQKGSPAAFFDLLEVEDDINAARGLFSYADSWARERGLKRILGPRGFTGVSGSGILVEGFEHRPALGIPYHLPHYDGFIKDAGYVKDQDLLSGYLGKDYVLPDRFYELAERTKARRGLRIKNFESKRELRRWIPKVAEVYRTSFVDRAIYPPTDEEIMGFVDEMMPIADPRQIKMVMKDDDIVGFIIAYPDISAALQRCKGKLFPFGWYHILREQKRTKWVNLNGVGVLPKYQGRGASVIMYAEIAKTLYTYDYEHGDIVQVGEINFKSKNDMETIGVKWYKRHRIYKRAFEPDTE
ncbi:MAG: hypothetical protein ABFQ89_05480 [Chloroflexota bacterium]